MTAYTKKSFKSFRPTLEALEDRCLPSASSLAAMTHGQQQQMVMQNQFTALADAAQILQQAQTTAAAQMSQQFAELQAAAKWIRIEVPQGWFQGQGLLINVSNTNLGSALNTLPSGPGGFYVSRDANHRTAQGYSVKFEYQYSANGYTSPWQTLEWSTSGSGNNEKIYVPNGWNPKEIDPSKNQQFKLNLRVTLLDQNNNPVPGEQWQTGAFTVTFFGGKSLADAGAQGQAGQTQSARDQFFATLNQTAGQINNANANAFAQAGRTLLNGLETVDGFLLQSRMQGWTPMSN